MNDDSLIFIETIKCFFNIFISFNNVTINFSLKLRAALRDNLLNARLLNDDDIFFAFKQLIFDAIH